MIDLGNQLGTDENGLPISLWISFVDDTEEFLKGIPKHIYKKAKQLLGITNTLSTKQVWESYCESED